jgi:hypothetical protein
LLRTEGFEIENDLVSMTEPKVTRFNTYVNQKKPKSFVSNLRITAEFAVKQGLGKIFGKKVSEQFANAYTVLCKKASQQPELF